MADVSVILSEVEQKIVRLINDRNTLASDNERLLRRNEELEDENYSLRKENEELREQKNKSVIVNALGGEEEIKESRALIKELVGEIDRCVSMLNEKE